MIAVGVQLTLERKAAADGMSTSSVRGCSVHCESLCVCSADWLGAAELRMRSKQLKHQLCLQGPVYLFVSLLLSPSYLPRYVPFYLSVCLSIYLSSYLSTYL